MAIADGWNMANTSTEQNLKRLKKLKEAKKKVGGATKKKILCTLLEHGQEASFNIGLDIKVVGQLRFAYIMLLDEEIIESAKEEEQAGAPARCGHPDCEEHEDVTHVKEGDAVDLHLCETHFEEAEERIVESNPAWKKGTSHDPSCRDELEMLGVRGAGAEVVPGEGVLRMQYAQHAAAQLVPQEFLENEVGL
jgi:hypothetical protein